MCSRDCSRASGPVRREASGVVTRCIEDNEERKLVVITLRAEAERLCSRGMRKRVPQVARIKTGRRMPARNHRDGAKVA